MRIPAWAPLVLAGALLLWQRDCSMKAQGALQAEVKAAEQRYAALEERGIVYDTTYVRDTVTLTRWRTQYESVRTQNEYRDTVWVKQFVLTADSTIKSCSVALETCEHRVALRDSMIGNLKQQLGLEKKRRPGLFAQLGQKAIWLGIGIGVDRILAR